MIGVELDPHCHMTRKRVQLADIIVCYKELPHTDVVERAGDLLDLVLRTVRGEIKPVMSRYDCRQISSYPTTLPRAYVDRIKAMEGRDRILSISIVHGFPYADVPELSGRVLVVTNDDRPKGDAVAQQLGVAGSHASTRAYSRGRGPPRYVTPSDSVVAPYVSHISSS